MSTLQRRDLEKRRGDKPFVPKMAKQLVYRLSLERREALAEIAAGTGVHAAAAKFELATPAKNGCLRAAACHALGLVMTSATEKCASQAGQRVTVAPCILVYKTKKGRMMYHNRPVSKVTSTDGKQHCFPYKVKPFTGLDQAYLESAHGKVVQQCHLAGYREGKGVPRCVAVLYSPSHSPPARSAEAEAAAQKENQQPQSE